MSIAERSLFWEKLGGIHARELEAFGVERFKRHQAFKYFQWRWSWETLRHSEQFGFLLRNTTPFDWVRAAITPAILDDDAWSDIDWPPRNRWLYVFASRLIWAYAGRHDPAGVLQLREPPLGDPLPITWRGRWISQDLANTALEVGGMTRGLRGGSPETILEVGAGYGRTAHALLNIYPRARYVIVDVEPAITISRWYLSALFPADRLTFLDPSGVDSILDDSVELAVSISSLHEMTPAQVDAYLRLFDRVLSNDGVVYLKQWTDWTNPDDHVRMRFAEYPIPTRWRPVFSEPAPIQTTFTHAAWRVLR